MSQAHIFISGSVQGVGFRYFIKSNARQFGLAGWTRNTADNKVEAVVQGEKKAIEQLVELCRKGPFLAEVKDIKISWEAVDTQLGDFSIT